MCAPTARIRLFARPARGLALAALAWTAAAAQVAIEPGEGGADFRIQGEYRCAAGGTDTLGVQVMALGAGAFAAFFLPGGLPGEGWNGRDRIRAAGTLQNGLASFSVNGFKTSIDSGGGTLTGTTPSGSALACAKVFRTSPTEGAKPPPGAAVLFDGSGVKAWRSGTAGVDGRGLLKPEGGAISLDSFSTFVLHLEFRVPFMPASVGQARGNGGIYLQSRYELQILDSFGASPSVADSMAGKRESGAFWEIFAPVLNMAYPPLSWQTYDIAFAPAEFDAKGVRTAPARITVLWNGVAVHTDRIMPNRTLAGALEGPAPGPLLIQDHDNPVYYRNIWIVPGSSSIGLAPRRPATARKFAGPSWSADGRRQPDRLPNRRSPARKVFEHHLSPASDGNAGHPLSGRSP